MLGGEKKQQQHCLYRCNNLVSVQRLKISQLTLVLHMLQRQLTPLGSAAELQHGYALRGTVEMCGCAAPPGGLEALGHPAQCRALGPGAHDHARAVVTLLQARQYGLAGNGTKLVGEGAVENQDVDREDPLADGGGVLQDEALVDEEDATEDDGDHGSQCQCHPEMGHPVVQGSDSCTVGEHTLQTHKQQPCWEGHTSAHIVHGLGMIHLEVSHHDQTHSVDAAKNQGAGVDPTLLAVLDHLGVAQKAHHHHHESSNVANQAEQAAFRRERATFTDEGDVLDGAACLREAWPGKVVCARHVVRPVIYRTNMVIHHSHGIHYPYSCDGEDRQAEGQDIPGSHWAGSELALSQAWGERGASGGSDDTTGGEIRFGAGGGVGSLTHRGTHGGGVGGMRGQKGE